MSAGRFARRWTALYTRGLPPALRAERLAEIESDVWEQQEAMGRGLATRAAIISRSLRGVPADLAWRYARRRRRRPAAGHLLRGVGWLAFGLALAVFLAVTGINAAPLAGLAEHQQWDPADVAAWERACAALFSTLVAGLVLLRRWPRLGALVAACGAWATALYCWWALALLAPAALAVTVGLVTIARRRGASRHAP